MMAASTSASRLNWISSTSWYFGGGSSSAPDEDGERVFATASSSWAASTAARDSSRASVTGVGSAEGSSWGEKRRRLRAGRKCS